MRAPVVVIAGPTAAGKTSAAISLALELETEIISADSVQVYRHLNIGSAKPSPEERALVPHHLIDIVDPDENFSGGMYQNLARAAIVQLEERGKTPIISGGTGLYIRSVIRGLFPGPSADTYLREQLEALEDRQPGYLHTHLSSRDPEAAARLHFNDRVRLIRAIEVFELTGKTISQHHDEHKKQPPFREHITYIIEPPRAILEERIRTRAQEMLEMGFIDEVKNLLAMGYDKELRSLQSVGYRQVLEYILGHETGGEAVILEAIVKAHLKYVKQQKTWFAREGTHIETPESLPISDILINLQKPSGGT